MSNLLIIFACLLLGIFFRRFQILKEGAHFTLNTIILYVPLPALILLNVPKIEWQADVMALTLTPWVFFFLSWLFFSQLGKILQWKKSLTGCLILTAGLGNTSFVGFPIIEALYGKEGVKLAILYDQPGTFLIVSSFGILVATFFADQKLSAPLILKRVFTFPPFLSFLVAASLGLCQIPLSATFEGVLERLSLLLTPLALISVGLQLKLSDIEAELRPLGWGLGFKLLLTPCLALVWWKFFSLDPFLYKVLVMEAAMAPMITAAIVAQTYDLEPKLAGLMVGLGVPLSFLTLGFWYFLL